MLITTSDERAKFVQDKLDSVTPTFHQLCGTNYTVCVATFRDGWSTLGHSVCVNPADFNQAVGEEIALENAMSKAKDHYWSTAGYCAKVGIEELQGLFKGHYGALCNTSYNTMGNT